MDGISKSVIVDVPCVDNNTFHNDKLSNHDIAYHMGLMDTFTIMCERNHDDRSVEQSDVPIKILPWRRTRTGKGNTQELPKSLISAMDARRRYVTSLQCGKGDPKDSAKAATMAQRSVEEVSCHAGSMSDVIVYSIQSVQHVQSSKKWTWAPSWSISITQRSTDPKQSRIFDTMMEAQQDADKFSAHVEKVSRWADSSTRRIVQAWAQRRQRSWCMISKDNLIHADLAPASVGNFVVVYLQLMVRDTEVAISALMHIMKRIDPTESHLIYLGTVECPGDHIVLYAVISVNHECESTKVRLALKQTMEDKD